MTDNNHITKKMLNDRLSEDARRIPDSLRNAVGSKHSTLSKLMRRYRSQATNCFIAPVWIIILSIYIDISSLLLWTYIIYTVAMGALYLWMYLRLRNVPSLMALPLVEGQRALISLNVARRWINYISWITCVPVIFLLFYEVYTPSEPELLWAGIIGGVIGTIIGLTWEIKNYRQMRSLIRAFDDPEAENV